jgi:hypothetical protein
MQKEYSVQINGLIKSDAQDRITEKSLLINLYGNNIIQTLAQFNMLKKKINADISFLPAPVDGDDEIKVQNIPFDDPEESPEGEICPQCGLGQLVVKSGRNGEFTACNAYPRCKYTRSI